MLLYVCFIFFLNLIEYVRMKEGANMKQVVKINLEIQRNGMPQYVKQVIEISAEGYVKHFLYPMVYLGTMKTYEFELDSKDINEFFNSVDVLSIPEVKEHYTNSYSYSLKIFFDDNSVKVNNGYINLKMPEIFHIFDEKLLEMVIFIEKPWLFTI